jgi:hypothetical protein
MLEEDPNFFKPLMPSLSRGHSQVLRAARLFMRLTSLIAVGYV